MRETQRPMLYGKWAGLWDRQGEPCTPSVLLDGPSPRFCDLASLRLGNYCVPAVPWAGQTKRTQGVRQAPMGLPRWRFGFPNQPPLVGCRRAVADDLPTAVQQPFLRPVVGFVIQMPIFGHIQPQIQVVSFGLPAPLPLLDNGIRAQRVSSVIGVEIGVNRRSG